MDAALLRTKLDTGQLDPSVLLSRTKQLDPSSRESPAFSDPRYLPFYYYLGQVTTHQKIDQVGTKLGLIAACFMQGRAGPVYWLGADAYDNGVRPPTTVINSNMKMFAKAGSQVAHMLFHPQSYLIDGDAAYRTDMALVTEKYSVEHTKIFLESFWAHLRPEGLLVVDYIHDDAVRGAFTEFCRVKNREPVVFDTRYGVGIVTR